MKARELSTWRVGYGGQAGEWDWISPFVKAADAREGPVVRFDDSPWAE
jgi:hypothetical protein